MKNKTLRTNSMKIKNGNCCIPCHFCTFCVYRLRKFLLNRQYKHKTGIFFHNRNGQRRRAETKNGMTFTSRKTSFLLITKMHGTKPLVL